MPLYALGVDKKQIIRVDMERPSLQIIKRYEWCSEEKKDRNLPKCQIFMDFDKIKKKRTTKKMEKRICTSWPSRYAYKACIWRATKP